MKRMAIFFFSSFIVFLRFFQPIRDDAVDAVYFDIKNFL